MAAARGFPRDAHAAEGAVLLGGAVTLYYQGERAQSSPPGGNYFGLYRATSAPDGRTFTTEEKTGIARGADPDVITLADGTVLMYYGDFDATIGGHLLVAKLNR